MNSTAVQDTETARRDRATQPWLKHAPTGWTRKRIKWAAPQVLKKSTDSSRTPVALESVESFTGRFLEVESVELADGTGIDFEPGDVLFGKLRPYLAKSLAPTFAGRCTGEMLVMRAKEVTPEYLKYLTLSHPFVETVNASTFGSKMPRADWRFVGHLLAPYPSRKQQEDIVAYLDRETGRIDTIIEKNRRLLGLIDEKRTAFISHAVTRGYDSRPKPKPSGLTWLKAVPSSWQVLPLKYALSLCEYGISESLSGNGHIKVLTMAEIQNGEVMIPDRGCLTEIAEDLIAQPGDLFFNRTNSRDLVGKVGLFRGAKDEVVTFASYLVRLRVNDKADPEYLNFLLNEYRFLNYIRGEAVLSINQANLSASRYSGQKIPLPPIDEQRAIVTRLKSQIASLDGIVAKVTRAIDLLRERRLALISAAVTGKLEVPRS